MIFSLKSNEVPIVRFIGEVSYKEPWMHFQRTADEFIIYIIKKGTLYIEEDNQRYVLNKNDFLVFQPGLKHQGYKSSVCEYFYIHFSHEHMHIASFDNDQDFYNELQMRRYLASTSNCLLNSFANDSTCYLPKHYTLSNFNHYHMLLRESIDSYNIHQENYKELVSCELLSMLIGISREYASSKIQTSSHSNKPLSTAQGILNFLNTEYSHKITSGEITEKFEGNFDYLNRCFKKMTGNTIFAYLNLIRINKAKELILTTHLPFKEIAYLVGIENPYYFSRLFKKLVGKTPTSYYNDHFMK